MRSSVWCNLGSPLDRLESVSGAYGGLIYIQSHLFFALLTTNTPCRPLSVESQIPVADSNPTQFPFRLTRGLAQARHSEVDGPVHVAQAGEQLLMS